MKTKIAVLLIALLGSYVGLYWFAAFRQLYARFPDIKHDVLREALRNMTIHAFEGRYADDDLDNDDLWIELFLIEVEEVVNS